MAVSGVNGGWTRLAVERSIPAYRRAGMGMKIEFEQREHDIVIRALNVCKILNLAWTWKTHVFIFLSENQNIVQKSSN